jgi:hypothetical protein
LSSGQFTLAADAEQRRGGQKTVDERHESGVRPCGWTDWWNGIDQLAGLSKDGSHGSTSHP